MSDAAPEIGSRLGPYLLKRLIGVGGMGRVYEAEDTAMDRTVALKLISSTYAQDPEYRKRLQREARIAGRLQEPHVVPIHAAGEVDGQLYVDMRLIRGSDLDTILRRSGPLPPGRAVSIVRQVAAALDAAHAAGVMHRDVKPANVLVTPEDFAYLVDFGIANASTEEKLTNMGDVLGTWAYMAPERFDGDSTNVTPRADVYALACVLFETLTGFAPFSGDRVSVITAHLTRPIPRPSAHGQIPSALDGVIARGMAKRPEDRFATAGELARAAEAAVGATSPRYSSSGFVAPQTIPSSPAPMVSGPTVSIPYGGAPPAPPPWHNQWSPHPSNPPTPMPTPRKSRRWIPIAVAAVVVVAVVAALGIWQVTKRHTGQDQAEDSTPTVDISQLDVGRYGTQPRALDGAATVEEGRFLESYRLAESIANPYEVDPTLSYLYGFPTPGAELAATAISGTSTPLVQPVLEKYGMISAYIVQGYAKRLRDFIREPEGGVAILMVSVFPNPNAAARAATEMDATDFAVNPDNEHTTIPGHSDALAHYRPGYASIAATMAKGALVASIVTSSPRAVSLDDLRQQVQTILDLQVPLMDPALATTEATLTALPRDPDDMLRRLFVVGDLPPVSDTFGSQGPRGAQLCADSQTVKDELLTEAGVDRCALSKDSLMLRAEDDAAAAGLAPKIFEANTDEFVDHEVAGPDGIPDAICFESRQAVWADNANGRFNCTVVYGRYVASVTSNEENDARQRAAAQYSILVNSG